jgi:hypothetical protein
LPPPICSALERDEFLAAVRAHAGHHQQAQFVLLQAHADVDVIGPQVHVVHPGEVAGGEGALLAFSGPGQPGDHRCGQSGVRAGELPQGGPEIAGRESHTSDATVQALYQRFQEMRAATTEHSQLLSTTLDDTHAALQLVKIQLGSLLAAATEEE